MRYVVKCFDGSGTELISLVVDHTRLFEVIDNFKETYQIKAFQLDDPMEVV